MTVTLAVPSVHATLAAALGALPATLTEPHVIEIDGDSQQFYEESNNITGITTTSTNNLTIRRKAGSLRPTLHHNTGRIFNNSTPNVIFQELSFQCRNSAIYCNLGADDCIVERCSLHSDTDTIIQIQTFASKLIIRNCSSLCYSQVNGGFMFLGGTSTDTKILNNTIIGTRNISGDRRIIRIESGAGTNLEIKNNYFYQNAGTHILTFISATNTGADINGNKYTYNGAAGRISNLFYWGGLEDLTVVDFNTRTGHEATLYTEIQSLPNMIPEFSEVTDLGIAVSGVAVDIEGTTREGTLDIGAHTIISGTTNTIFVDTCIESGLDIEDRVRTSLDSVTTISYESAGSGFEAIAGEDLTASGFENRRRITLINIASSAVGWQVDDTYSYVNDRGAINYFALAAVSAELTGF